MMRLIVVLAMLPALAFGATTTVTRAVVANTNNLIISHTNLTLNGTATVYAVKFHDGTTQTTAGGGGGGDLTALSNSVKAVGLVASNALPLTGGAINGELVLNGNLTITNGVYSFRAQSYMGYPAEEDAQFFGSFTGIGSGLSNLQASALVPGSVLPALDGHNLTNLPVYIASGGTVAQTSTGAVLTITGGGGSAALSPWTNNVNAAGYTLTNTLAIAWTNASISVDSGGTNIVWTVGTNSFRLPIP